MLFQLPILSVYFFTGRFGGSNCPYSIRQAYMRGWVRDSFSSPLFCFSLVFLFFFSCPSFLFVRSFSPFLFTFFTLFPLSLSAGGVETSKM